MVTPLRTSNASATAVSKPAKMRRRRCLNDNVLFPVTKPNRKFCNVQCKNEYGRYGAAYGPLRDKLTKLIEKKSKEATRELRAEVEQLKTAVEKLMRRMEYLKDDAFV